MKWRVISSESIGSASDFRIARMRGEDGAKYMLYGPKGSGADLMEPMERNTADAFERFFGITEDVQIEGVRLARKIHGCFATVEEARLEAEAVEQKRQACSQ